MHFNGAPQLGVGTLTALLSALALGPEMDADVLLLLRDEIFSKTDCLYHGLLIIRRIILSAKRGSNIESRPESFESDAEEASVAPPQSSSSALESVAKNALDMLRMTECLEEGDDRLDVSNCMVQNDDDKSAGGSDSESDASEGSDDEGTDKKVVAKSTRNERTGIRKRALEEEEKKTSNNRKSRKLEMLDARCHRKAFSRAWLALLAVPMTPSQHKIVLRHIPDLVMPHLDQPLLLADYLTRSYECGGVTAVLALESLFNVILKHNLDYPQFFRSLYRLCTVEVFSAKYRVKFMKLLNASLRSVNLTAYVVASFIKRLARVSLAAPSPVALFCLAQITWLLRRHPQCIRLIHKPTTGSARGSDSFKPEEEDDLEQTGALESSLWELDALRRHHFHAVATLASALDNESSTQSGAKEIPLNIDDFINQSYASLIESELKSTKKHSALSFSPGDFLPSQSDAAAGAALFLMAPATKEAEPFCKSLNMFA
jgi:U3 small nucleolar RNA-associated protein 19